MCICATKRCHAVAGRACRVARACSAAWARPRARRGRAAAWAQRRWAREQQPLRILAQQVRSRGRARSGGSGWSAQELSNSGLPKPLTQNSEKPCFFKQKMYMVSWPRGGHVFVVRNWPHVLKVNINSNAVHLLVTNFRPRNCVHFQSRCHRFFRFLVIGFSDF